MTVPGQFAPSSAQSPDSDAKALGEDFLAPGEGPNRFPQEGAATAIP